MEAPAYLDDVLKPIWREVVSKLPASKRIDPISLESYCGQVYALREASKAVKALGVAVEDQQGRKVPNPALKVMREMQAALSKWGDEYAPAAATIRRRSGPMYDATTKAVASAKHLQNKDEYAGAIAAAKTLAWLIDEAQREGIESLQKAAFGTIPTYLKACAELQITPASTPVAPTGAATPTGSRLGKLRAMQGGAGA